MVLKLLVALVVLIRKTLELYLKVNCDLFTLHVFRIIADTLTYAVENARFAIRWIMSLAAEELSNRAN
jgi:hypothetical protein